VWSYGAAANMPHVAANTPSDFMSQALVHVLTFRTLTPLLPLPVDKIMNHSPRLVLRHVTARDAVALLPSSYCFSFARTRARSLSYLSLSLFLLHERARALSRACALSRSHAPSGVCSLSVCLSVSHTLIINNNSVSLSARVSPGGPGLPGL
jgi:hypothetical protein